MKKLGTFYIFFSVVLLTFSQGIDDPVPEPIVKSGLTITLEDYATAPRTSNFFQPYARLSIIKTVPDNSGRIFVNDMRGQLYSIKDGEFTTFLDLNEHIPDFIDVPNLGTGFHGFAFHPDFETNGKFYTLHTEPGGTAEPDFEGPVQEESDAQGVVMEWTLNDPASEIFEGDYREMMRIAFPQVDHMLQDVAFNPNAEEGDPDYGMMYITMGDGGSIYANLPDNTGRLDGVMGTILRIDPFGSNSENGQYGIPEDNPFASDDDSTTLGEIWAYGFRNPHRISWDTEGDQKMLIGGIGQDNIEEVNIGIAGGNYGWPTREGTFLFQPENLCCVYPLPEGDDTLGFTYPSAQYDHDEGRAIIGGFVYRGEEIPELYGKYIFGDNVNGRLFYLDADSLQLGTLTKIHELTIMYEGEEQTMLEILDYYRADIRFGVDYDGGIFITTKPDGVIRKITGAAIVGVEEEENIPVEYSLQQNYPNPFNPTTSIKYQVSRYENVTLKVYDILGNEVATLVNERKTPGSYEVKFNASHLSSGVYFYTLKAGAFMQTRKLLLLK